MRHYEIVFLVHPDQSEQVPSMMQRYETLIKNNGGLVHRLEDWGRKQLTYPINKTHKAHFIMMNIECNDEALKELANSFKFNDAILRNLILRKNKAVTETSIMLKQKERKGRDNLNEGRGSDVEPEAAVNAENE